MKETNLTSGPRLIGRCCFGNTLYSKATFLLLVFLVPLIGFSQVRQLPTLKEKEAAQEAWLQKKYGNKPEEIQANYSGNNLRLVPQNKVQQSEYQRLIQKLGIDEEKYLQYGFTEKRIMAKMQDMLNEKQNVKGIKSSSVLARSGGSDACDDAVTLNCGETTSGDTFGASDAGWVECGGFPSGVGVWYTILGNGMPNQITVTNASTGFDPSLQVYTSNNGDCNTLDCYDSTTGQGTATVSFTPAYQEIYYIYVTSNDAEGSYSITRTSTDCIDGPSGDGLTTSSAIPIACGDQIAGSNVGVTATEVPISCGVTAESNGVWYTFTAVAGTPETITVDTSLGTTDFDSQINVYQGTPGNITCVGSDDDDGTELLSSFTFTAALDVQYFFYVDGFLGEENDFILRLTCNGNVVTPPPSAPSNDTCPEAVAVECGMTYPGTTFLATNTGTPSTCGVSSSDRGVWYVYNGAAGTITASLCGSTSSDTILGVFSGSCGTFTCDAQNDDFCGLQSQVTWEAEADTDYYIFVTSFSGSTNFTFDIAISCIGAPEPPANDACADAEPITCGQIREGDTSLAEVDNVPFCDSDAPTATPGVWYSYTETQPDKVVTLFLEGLNYDAVVSVYTGGCGALTCLVGENGDFSDDSQVSFPTEVGTEYLIFVSGFFGDTGAYILDLTCADDPCANITKVFCDTPVYGNNSGANGISPAVGPFCGTSPGAPGVLYEFIAPEAGFTEITTCGSNFDTKLNVYTGYCGSFDCLAGNDDAPSGTCDESGSSRVLFLAEEGTSYFIWVSGFSNATGDFTLNINCLGVADNDLCEDAVALTCGQVVSGTTDLATTRDNPERDCDGQFGDSNDAPGVWYSIAGTGGIINLSLCEDTDFDSEIGIFTGSCGDLTCLGGNDDACGSQSEVEFSSTYGEIYYIFVTGFGTATGDYTLSVTCECGLGGDPQQCYTIYDGYDDPLYSQVTLEGQIINYDGEVTYEWSNGVNGTGDDYRTITLGVSDITGGAANFSVVMTDEAGCSQSQSFFVTVMDVNCDTRGTDKVEVCHSGQTICVAPSAVAAHLQHGDYLGACGNLLCSDFTPQCDVTLTSDTTDVSANGATLSWTSATGIVDGYYLSVVSSGGIIILDNEDVGNVTSYILGTVLEFETEYLVTITPYNSNGASTEGCETFSFVTQSDPSAIICGEVTNTVYCYEDFDTTQFYFYSLDGTSRLQLNINAGGVESGWDYLVILDSDGVSELYRGSSSNLSGVQVISTGTSLTVTYDLFDDNIGSCQDDDYTPLDFDVQCYIPPPPPANDDCDDAIMLTVNADLSCGAVTSGTVYGATDSGVGNSTCSGTENNDVWFSFVATSPEHRIVISNVTGSETDMYHVVYAGNCGALGASIKCSDNNTSDLTGLTPNATYYVQVYTYNPGEEDTTFNICVGTPPQPPINDNPCGAIQLPVNENSCSFQTFSNESATGTTGVGSASCGSYSGGDVWFSFVVPSGGAVTIDTQAGSLSDSVIALYTGSCNGTLTQIPTACNDDSGLGFMSRLTRYDLTPNSIVYIRVFEWGGNVFGTFGICVSTPPPNDNCSGAIEVPVSNDLSCSSPVAGSTALASQSLSSCSGSANDDVWFKFQATATTHSIIIQNTSGTSDIVTQVYSACGGTSIKCQNSPDSPVDLTGLTVGNWYYFRIHTNSSDAAYSYFNVCVGTPPLPINLQGSNEYPGAPEVTCGNTYLGTTVGATNSNPGTCVTTATAPGVWYYIVGNGNPVTASLCGTPYDSKISIFNSTLGCITGEDDDFTNCGGNDPNVTFPTTFGNIYYIYVHGYNSLTGNYQLELSCASARPDTDSNDVSHNGTIDWSMAPNPTRGNVTLDLGNYLRNDVTVEVIDFTGKVISSQSVRDLKDARYTLELNSSLPAGMYFVRVATDSQVSSKKLVIMR